MTTHKIFALSLAFLLTAGAVAQAAVGTPKANGQFGGYGWIPRGSSSQVVHRSPMVYRSPAVSATPAAQAPPAAVAQAPTATRRYSAAPSTQPTQGAAVEPSTARCNVYQPHYSTGGRSGGRREQWALPKTDARKFNSR
ncbi:MAG: hypothetical protein IT424_15515 [Pirellulales bacterium]|nr:hypothetical protein [Pirellulales bacterium]